MIAVSNERLAGHSYATLPASLGKAATDAQLEDWVDLDNADSAATRQRRRQAYRNQLWNVVSDPVRLVHTSATDGWFLASPSLLKLALGTYVAVLEHTPGWGYDEDAALKQVHTSNDGGLTWALKATVGPLWWPQIFQCRSGVYIIGVKGPFARDNNLFISKMLSADASKWSPPKQLTTGWSVISINTGVDVSNGRVTKTFEIIPTMAAEPATTKLRSTVAFPIDPQPPPEDLQFYSPRTVRVAVDSTDGFVPYMFVKALFESRAVFFRVLSMDSGARTMLLRLETMNLWIWSDNHTTMELKKGTVLTVGSSSQVYGAVDWISMAMSADESADLTNAAVWTFSNMVANPAAIHQTSVMELQGVGFRADWSVRESLLGFQPPGMEEWVAYMAGFGSLYWMEGVPVRMQDRHGGSGKVWNVMRVNNDLHCNMAAIVEFDDSHRGSLHGRFLTTASIPGLAIGHPAIVYDKTSDLYWMASNINRDSLRPWVNAKEANSTHPSLHITMRSTCEVDRSTLALYYSGNLLDWSEAGVIDYTQALYRHFTYPHMMIDEDDLVLVSRCSFGGGDVSGFFNNHNSNSISFHRVRNFRQLARRDWAVHREGYSEGLRKTPVTPRPEFL